VKATGGYASPPNAPGIGVELNEDFIQKYRVA
jgi:L-alanine-DL-glutamate epimerase-like enolase superfamily enzyme